MEENKDTNSLENQETPETPKESASSGVSEPEYDESEPITVKQVGIKWGVISGVVGILVFLVLAITGLIFKSSVSWISAIPFIVILVLAHREFKSEGDGFMSYSKGLGLGLVVAGIGAVIQTIFSYIYIKFVDTEYYANQTAALVEQWEKQGLNEEQIEAALGFSQNMMNPEMGILFGILGGIFFGFIISLIVTAFTKKNKPDLEN